MNERTNESRMREMSFGELYRKSMELRKTIKEGMKVTLTEMQGETQMPSGLNGVITYVDDLAQIHVRWENGSTLAINPFLDEYVIN